MITANKVREFIQHDGDIIDWVHNDGPTRQTISTEEWAQIDVMLSEIDVLSKPNHEEWLQDYHQRKIKTLFESELTYRELYVKASYLLKKRIK